MKRTIKTIVIVVLAMLVIFTTTFTIFTFSLIGCDNMTELRELIAKDMLLKDLSNIEPITPEVNESKPTITIPETDTKVPSKVETEVVAPEDNPFEGIEPLCIWNMNGIKITVLGLEMKGFDGPEMYIEIENKTAKNLLFGIEDVSVNGYRMDAFWTTKVTAGSKAREIITWREESCIENDIDDIVRVEGVFRVSDADTWTLIIETPTIGINFE